MAPLLKLLAGTALLQAVVANYVPHLLPRQTEAPGLEDTSDCLSAILDVAGDAPYPPAEIVSVMTGFFMTVTGTYDAACGWQTAIPSSLAGEWYSYQDEALSWYSDNADRFSSALEKCPDEYKSSASPCTETIEGLPRPAGAQATGGSGGSSGGSGGGGGGGGGSSNGGEGQRGYLVPGMVMGVAAVLGVALVL